MQSSFTNETSIANVGPRWLLKITTIPGSTSMN